MLVPWLFCARVGADSPPAESWPFAGAKPRVWCPHPHPPCAAVSPGDRSDPAGRSGMSIHLDRCQCLAVLSRVCSEKTRAHDLFTAEPAYGLRDSGNRNPSAQIHCSFLSLSGERINCLGPPESCPHPLPLSQEQPCLCLCPAFPVLGFLLSEATPAPGSAGHRLWPPCIRSGLGGTGPLGGGGMSIPEHLGEGPAEFP